MNLFGANYNLLFILLPLLLAQYALATFSLTRLAYCRFKTGAYVAWNIFILLGFFVGSIAFLIFYFATGARKKAERREREEDAKKDGILIDAPLYGSDGAQVDGNAQTDGNLQTDGEEPASENAQVNDTAQADGNVLAGGGKTTNDQTER